MFASFTAYIPNIFKFGNTHPQEGGRNYFFLVFNLWQGNRDVDRQCRRPEGAGGGSVLSLCVRN